MKDLVEALRVALEYLISPTWPAIHIRNRKLPCEERDNNSMRRERSDRILNHRVRSAMHVHPGTSCAGWLTLEQTTNDDLPLVILSDTCGIAGSADS